MSERHNHFTRDIKPLGQCPACDRYHDKHTPPPPASEPSHIWRDKGSTPTQVRGEFVPVQPAGDSGAERLVSAESAPVTAEPREWTLRISSENDGSGYLYSGSDVSYPQDDYLRVIEKSAYDALRAEVERLREALERIVNEAPSAGYVCEDIAREALEREEK